MIRPTYLLFGAAACVCVILPATAAPEPAATEQKNPATTAFEPGDAFPADGLPSQWLRGTPVTKFEPGIAYVITLWNTRSLGKLAPGGKVIDEINEIGPNPALKSIVLLISDPISDEALKKRLSYPSQTNDLPLADVRQSDSPTAKLWLSRMSGPNLDTFVVRDGRVVWAGGGYDLKTEDLRTFAAEDFNYDTYLAAKTASDDRTRELSSLILKEYGEAVKAGNTDRADAIIAELQAEKNLHPFLGMRLYDALCQKALEINDVPAALGTMQAMADAYPQEEAVQSWAHKMIVNSEPMFALGQAQAGRAAAKVAELRNDGASIRWWRAAADHFLAAGDKEAALAALESAEKSSQSYKDLERYRAGAKSSKAAPTAEPSLAPETSWNGKAEFPFSLKNPGQLPLVRATVNGTEGVFVLDTGAEITVLTPQFAERANLGGRIHQQGAQVNGSGDGVDFAMIATLKIGDAEFQNFHALLVDVSHLKQGIGEEPAGILGNNVLLDAPLTLDYRNGQATWNGEIPASAVAVPSRFEGLSILLAASLDGKRLPLLLDTGSSVNALFRKDWQGETVNHGSGQVADAGGTTEQAAEFAKVAAFSIGDTAPQPAEFRLTDTHRCLGTPFLIGRAIYLNAAKQQVMLTPDKG